MYYHSHIKPVGWDVAQRNPSILPAMTVIGMLRPVSLGYPRVDVDLDKALNLADALEDDVLGRKLEQRQ